MSAKESLDLKLVLRPEENNIKTFSTQESLIEYIEKEVDFWSHRPIAQVADIFAASRARIKSQIDAGNWQSFLAELSTLNSNGSVVYSETALGRLLVELRNQNQLRALGAYAFVFGPQIETQYLHQREYWMGVFAAFQFQFPDSLAASDTEKGLLQDLRGELRSVIESTEGDAARVKQVGDAITSNLTSTLNEWRANQEAWKEKAENDYRELLSTANERLKEESDRHAVDFENRTLEHKNTMEAMKETFKTQVRLKEPAQYWENMANDYRKDAITWRNRAILAGLFLIFLAASVLYWPPVLRLEAGFSGFRVALLTAILLSTSAYLMVLFVRLATSAEHLSRDAKERLQLTHVFLALSKDNIIDPKEREIVLQALFSRADTGLLKGETGPTMPGPIGALVDALRNK